MGYRENGLATYGTKCEICGHSAVQVHHIDYQEQHEMENKIRDAIRNRQKINALIDEAKSKGYLEWKGNQLAKNDSTKNLAVLCGNCHHTIHVLDVGKRLLKLIPERR